MDIIPITRAGGASSDNHLISTTTVNLRMFFFFNFGIHVMHMSALLNRVGWLFHLALFSRHQTFSDTLWEWSWSHDRTSMRFLFNYKNRNLIVKNTSYFQNTYKRSSLRLSDQSKWPRNKWTENSRNAKLPAKDPGIIRVRVTFDVVSPTRVSCQRLPSIISRSFAFYRHPRASLGIT